MKRTGFRWLLAMLCACLLPFGAWAEDELRGYEPGKGYIYVTLGRYCQTVDGGTIGQDSWK